MKTLKEFDYDLWAIEENGRKRYFARIKATGEETEVSLEVMRLLLRQEKQMRREYAKQQTIGPVLSLDAIRDGGGMDESAWLLDTRQRIDSEVLTAELTDAFCKTLTDSQRSIFRECLIEGKARLRMLRSTASASLWSTSRFAPSGERQKYIFPDG